MKLAMLLWLMMFGQNIDMDKFINDVFYPATVSLYRESDTGDFEQLCTATAIVELTDGYVFASASHCFQDEFNPNFYFIGRDEDNYEQHLIPVTGHERGDPASGLDISL